MKVGDKTVLSNGMSLNSKVFCDDFSVAYSVTVYKYQGGEIDEEYKIHTLSRWIRR